MNIQTSKIELAKVILDMDNPKLIEEIILLIKSKSALTEKEKTAIDEAIHSLENNEGIAHNIVMEETRSRYSKYFK
jgi:ABC-type iron transport system FetAB ATPase subunit